MLIMMEQMQTSIKLLSDQMIASNKLRFHRRSYNLGEIKDDDDGAISNRKCNISD
jgi:hypothetical protein